ncbi:hypothetical protein [Wolbachia endosymbiont of Armadillidium arcangelii]|uniref:Uncharacterized protein n=1 Tax=Wolbachia endosymbiont of Armadillidium arcangelii TaxID=3158571 RepID=A0AAU7Q199_9RICK
MEIFQSFEEQMTKVMDISWKRGIEKLAMDAVSRVINYISANSKEEGFFVNLITKGLILGKSKSNTLPQCVFRKPVELLIKNIASDESKNNPSFGPLTTTF